MAIKNKAPSAKSIYESIFAALDEFTQRHQGQGPARIIITVPVYMALSTTTFMNTVPERERFCNIPVVVEAGEGYHIHLAEPEITIYEIDDTPRVYLPKDKGEG